MRLKWNFWDAEIRRFELLFLAIVYHTLFWQNSEIRQKKPESYLFIIEYFRTWKEIYLRYRMTQKTRRTSEMLSGELIIEASRCSTPLSNRKFRFFWFPNFVFFSRAPAASKEIAEFIREVACQHDQLAKNLARLGKQEKTNAQHILLSPIWKILKVENRTRNQIDLLENILDTKFEN